MIRVSVVAGAMAVFGAAAFAAGPADWPQWRGPARDGQAPGLAPAWPAQLKPAWKVDVGVGHASPVVVGERVFLFSRQGDEEVLEAFESGTGKRVWRQAYAAPYSMNMAAFRHGKGPKATPVVADGRIVTFGISGILSAHDAATGRLLWRKDFSKEYPATSPTYGTAQSPVVDKGLVIAHVGGEGQGALTAFDAATGGVKWTWKGDGPGYGSPVVADIGGTRQVVTFTQTLLAGVSAETGQLLWKLPFTTDYEQNAVTPIVNGNMVVFSGLDQPLKAVRIVQRAGQWRPEILWENADVAAYMSTPVVAGGRLIGHSHKKKGQFFAVDLATGKTVWLSEGRQGDNAALVAVGDTVLALVTDGEIVVLDAKGPAYAEKRRYDVADTPTWAHLAVTGQGVLVKDEKTLSLLRF